MADLIRKWTPERIIDRALDKQEARMQTAVIFLQGQVKRLINRGNRKGDNPSKPGEPPKKVTGGLFDSIFAKVIRLDRAVVGIVGSNMKYARRLELGFVGRDSRGRLYAQAPRPYLRRAISENRDRLRKILGAK